MNKFTNIKHTLQIIRHLPLPIAYRQVEKWVMEHDGSEIEYERKNSIKYWLSSKYKSFNWWKK